MIFALLLLNSVLAQDIAKLETDLNELKQLVEESYLILSNSVKKSQDLGRDTRLIMSKSAKAISRMQQATDVSIYSMFNTEIQRKHSLMETKLKQSEGFMNDNPFTKKIKITLDYFTHKQRSNQIFHEDFNRLEKTLKETKEIVESIYDFSTIFVFVAVIAAGVLVLWKNVKTAQKKHYL